MKTTKLALYIVFSCLLACRGEVPTQFTAKALNEPLLTMNGESTTFGSILEKHKGNTVLITLWASWCRDCHEELPRVKSIQNEKTEIDYVFLSLDRNPESWKKGIAQFEIEGDHYFLPSGWDGPLADFIDLDWITRYMVIDPYGNIKLYKAIKAKSSTLRTRLTH